MRKPMQKTMPWMISALIGAIVASGLMWLVSSVFFPTANKTTATYQSVESPQPLSFARAINGVAPAVVSFYTTAAVEPQFPLENLPGSSGLPQPFEQDQHPNSAKQAVTSLGSGVILHPDGYLITNHHVIANAQDIRAILYDGRDVQAEVIGHDPDTDLAVLKIEADKLPSVKIASEKNIQVGDLVLAIGYPYGLGQAVSMGIVSALGRSGLNLSTFEDYIQTDAAINRGSSGGALVNSEGALVGISTAILTESGGSQGIGFAIPAYSARKVMAALIEDGRVKRGWLGILPARLRPDEAAALGLGPQVGIRIKTVAKDTPASIAGLEVDDIIMKVGNKVVGNEYQALKAVSSQPPGTRIKLEILRGKNTLLFEVEVAERPQSD